MPELRKDPVIGRWVIISVERAKRPHDFKFAQEEKDDHNCPFCSGKESNTPPEIFAIRPSDSKPNSPGWEVRVVPSISPLLGIEGKLNRRGKGMYDLMDGIGAHEIIIETPQHLANIWELPDQQIEKILLSYIERISDLGKDSRFKYVLLFKNYGWRAGGSKIRHSRSQLIATPVTPKRVKEELIGARQYYEFKERCVFCDIISQELYKKDRIVVETDKILAVAPFASRFPFEIWILPKEHGADFFHIDRAYIPDLAKVLRLTLNKISKALNDPPYNFILHTAPFRRSKRPGYWKTIDQDYHWHFEIMPRITRVAGFEWGSGFYINPTPPEEAAKYLREVEI